MNRRSLHVAPVLIEIDESLTGQARYDHEFGLAPSSERTGEFEVIDSWNVLETTTTRVRLYLWRR